LTLALRAWRPAFLDYLYVAFTNASAFSPTDAMPLSVRVNTLMLIESISSFLTVGLVAARAVNNPQHITRRRSGYRTLGSGHDRALRGRLFWRVLACSGVFWRARIKRSISLSG
jgi:hypothetical protein